MGAFLDELREHALSRPWLLAVPLAGLLGLNLLDFLSGGMPGAVALRMLLTAAMTVAVTALFAELWIGDGRSVDPGRLFGAGVLYLIPYPLLLLYGVATAPLVYWWIRQDLPAPVPMAGLFLFLSAGKFVAFAAGAVSSIAVVRRGESAGRLGALLLGVRALRANAWFFTRLFAGLVLFQAACVYLCDSLGVRELSRFVTTVIPLFGCVGAPILAWNSGRLAKA